MFVNITLFLEIILVFIMLCNITDIDKCVPYKIILMLKSVYLSNKRIPDLMLQVMDIIVNLLYTLFCHNSWYPVCLLSTSSEHKSVFGL